MAPSHAFPSARTGGSITRAWGRSVDRGTRRPGIEPRYQKPWVADVVSLCGRQHRMVRHRKCHPEPTGSETLCMRGSFMRENREISWPLAGWSSESHGQGQGRNPMMYDHEKSDGPVVPANHRNKAPQGVADGGEERGSAKGNLRRQNTHRTQCRGRVHSALTRVRRVAELHRWSSGSTSDPR